jgi:hypothetical protein
MYLRDVMVKNGDERKRLDRRSRLERGANDPTIVQWGGSGK